MCILLTVSCACYSGRRQQPHLADQRHVPAVRRGQRCWTAPGWQEAQIQHQDQEQQLVAKVQWNIPVVSNRASFMFITEGEWRGSGAEAIF